MRWKRNRERRKGGKREGEIRRSEGGEGRKGKRRREEGRREGNDGQKQRRMGISAYLLVRKNHFRQKTSKFQAFSCNFQNFPCNCLSDLM